MTTGEYLTSIAFGGITGGVTNGILAKVSGNRFWDGGPRWGTGAPGVPATPEVEMKYEKPTLDWRPKIERNTQELLDPPITDTPDLLVDTKVRLGDRSGFYKEIDPNSSAGWKSLDRNDANHFFSEMVDNSMGIASKFTLKGGDNVYRSLYQLPGRLRGTPGIFEWIVEGGGKMTHRIFIPNGTVTGIPNNFPK